MKITIGGSLGMTLTNIPYSPAKADTTLLIEKEVNEDMDEETLNAFIEEFSEKIDKFLHKDLDRKIEDVMKQQKDTKRKMENML